MKNMLKRHDLLKLVSIVCLIAFILTWIIPGGAFSGTELGATQFSRFGLDEIFRAPFYGLSYYLPTILFFLAIGLFYGVLTVSDNYKKMVLKLAKLFKGKEIVFVILSTLLFAIYASVSGEILPILIFAPFIISVMLNMNLGKVVGVASTFGALMLGLIGPTYTTYGIEFFHQFMGTEVTTAIGMRALIFVIAFVLYSVFMILYIKKHKKDKEIKEEKKCDTFLVSDVNNKDAKVWPMIVVFVLLFALTILGYFDWKGSFNLDVFNNFHQWLIELEVRSQTLFYYLIGNVGAFGNWDLYTISYILIIAALVIKLISGIKFDDLITNMGNGFKKLSKTALLVVLAYTVFVVSYSTYIVPNITNFFENLVEAFNPIITSIVVIISSILNVDFGFTGFSLGSFYAAQYPDMINNILVIFTSINGLVSFVAPTSIVLLAGLSYANVSYKDWIKFIWKFLLAMLAIMLIIFVVLTYL